MYKVLVWFAAVTIAAGFYGPRVEAADAETITTRGVTAPQVLSAPLLLFPAADSTLSTRKVRCIWTRVSGADRYRVQMSSDAFFSSTIRDTTLSDTSRYFWMPGYGLYYWRVRAESQTDVSEWSELRNMNVPSSVPPAKLLSPACGSVSAVQPVELSWSAAGSAHEYFIVVARDSLLKNVVADTALLSWYTKCSMPELAPNSRYYWCVYSRGVEYGGEPSDTCVFTTAGVSATSDPAEESHCRVVSEKGLVYFLVHCSATFPQCQVSYRIVSLSGNEVHRGTAEIAEGHFATVIPRSISAGFYLMYAEIKENKGCVMHPIGIIIP
ncbi:MAG: hypothetical protein RL156_648, partial [Bacteroidota bacterium]|jgi:hypothetical protein